MKAIAPGKLILSGEHSVVYGHPALAMAVNRYVTADISAHESSFLALDFADLSYEHSLTFNELEQLKNRIKDSYRLFVNGEYNIREVLQKPFELAQFALGLCVDVVNFSLKQGMKIQINSTIPIGCGMGSSAATILSIIHAIAKYAGEQVPTQKIYELALQAENMQHGISSGLDLYVSLYGGCCYVKDKKVTAKTMPEIAMYLVNTGTPKTTTGECVATVAKHFKQSSIGHDFAAITDAMVGAITLQQDLRNIIYTNHQLLNRIGVVPEKVNAFIDEIYQMGGAAKICGAGAISGDNAGIVMIIIDDITLLNRINKKYDYPILPIVGEARGAYVDL